MRREKEVTMDGSASGIEKGPFEEKDKGWDVFAADMERPMVDERERDE